MTLNYINLLHTNTSDIIALQHDLDNLNLWSSGWLLKFNISKTMVMHIGNNNSEHSAYFMNDQLIINTVCEKDLGVLIDSKLKFHDHTSAIVSKAS